MRNIGLLDSNPGVQENTLNKQRAHTTLVALPSLC